MSLLSATRAALRRRSRGRTLSDSRDGDAHLRTTSQPAQHDSTIEAQTHSREVPAEVTITPYQDGPYLLRGPFILRDQDGGEIPNARRVVALCRCGKSRTRPFCDGTHRLVGFHAPSSPERSVDLATTSESA